MVIFQNANIAHENWNTRIEFTLAAITGARNAEIDTQINSTTNE